MGGYENPDRALLHPARRLSAVFRDAGPFFNVSLIARWRHLGCRLLPRMGRPTGCLAEVFSGRSSQGAEVPAFGAAIRANIQGFVYGYAKLGLPEAVAAAGVVETTIAVTPTPRVGLRGAPWPRLLLPNLPQGGDGDRLRSMTVYHPPHCFFTALVPPLLAALGTLVRWTRMNMFIQCPL